MKRPSCSRLPSSQDPAFVHAHGVPLSRLTATITHLGLGLRVCRDREEREMDTTVYTGVITD